MSWSNRTLAASVLTLGAGGFLALAAFESPAVAMPLTVNFTAAIGADSIEGGWDDDTLIGDVAVTGSLIFDGGEDALGGEDSLVGGSGSDTLYGDVKLLDWSVTIGDVTFDQTNSSPSSFTTLPDTLVVGPSDTLVGDIVTFPVVSSGIELALDGVNTDNTPFWMQLNKTASSLGVVEFSSYDDGTLDNGNPGPPVTPPIEFPFDGRAGVLSLSASVVIPEPATALLLATGLAALAVCRRRPH